MGKGKTPSYNPPPPPKLQTADELYGAATKYGQEQFPLAFGARESGLSDLAKGNQYYEQFQPTSFEQALANQYYQNVWPQTERSIKHGLSLSGLDSSPILARELGRAQGELGYNIGSSLMDLGNTRATNSLNARLGIDPMSSIIGPHVNTGMNQGNAQAGLDYDYAQQLAQVQYQNDMNKFNQRMGLARTLGMFSPVAGAIYGGATGGSAGFGQSLSGSLDMASSLLPMMAGGGSYGRTASSVNPWKYAVSPFLGIGGNKSQSDILGFDTRMYR